MVRAAPRNAQFPTAKEAGMARETEVLLLADENGDYFVVSRETIEQGRLEGELKEKVINAVESEVSGFAFGQTQFTPIYMSPAPQAGPYGVVGTFDYQMDPGVKISNVLRPGQ
jgi:hypothetical protein